MRRLVEHPAGVGPVRVLANHANARAAIDDVPGAIFLFDHAEGLRTHDLLGQFVPSRHPAPTRVVGMDLDVCQTTSGRGPLATRGMGPRLRPAPQPLAIDGEQRLPRGGFGQARSRRRRRPVGPGLREPAPQEIIQPGCRRRWSAGHRTVPRHGHAEFCASVANGVGLIRPERRFSRSR